MSMGSQQYAYLADHSYGRDEKGQLSVEQLKTTIEPPDLPRLQRQQANMYNGQRQP